jgi:hypothetical protein
MDTNLFIDAGALVAAAALAIFLLASKSAQAARIPAMARRRPRQRR